MPPRQRKEREPVVKRERTVQQDATTGRFVKQEDSDERRRLSVEAAERGTSIQDIANRWWSGSYATARREIDRWYAKHPSPDALTMRRILAGKAANLEAIVRGVMEREHFVVDKGQVVLDHEGKPLLDDKPIYEGVDRILKIGDFLIKITPNVAAHKVTAEISGDAIEAAILAAEEQIKAELAALEREEAGDDGAE